MKHQAILAAFLTLFSPALLAQADAAGQVELPLAVYNRLVEGARDPQAPPRPAPASYALGSAKVTVAVGKTGSRSSARVEVELKIDVLEDDWILIPVLPAGTAVETATVGGKAVQLIATPRGLAWATRKQGSHVMKLAYLVDAARSDAGRSLAVPLPRAASIGFVASLPGTGLDVAVIPSAGMTATANGGVTRVSATVPATGGVQLSWRLPAATGHALSRASYAGQLAGDAVVWKGELTVELLGEESVTLPLLPSSVTLRELQVDGREATILIDGERFATLIQGRGRHTVTAGFEVPVERRDGPPRIELRVPPVPVSRFELTLPGDQEVSVDPASSVTSSRRGATTVATAHVPLTSTVQISWAEAVPEEIRTEVRSSATVYHAAQAEEGVLYVKALAELEVSRGETNVLRLEVPADVQVDRVSASGAVADWRLGKPEGEAREITVFLDRQLQGRLVVEVGYDRSIGTGDSGAGTETELVVPLLRSKGAQRQRGMVALLSGQDLALKPIADDGATRVGENQLPAFVREALELPVAHTYKYVETPPRITVEAVAPERRQGRFDARIDTLVSLGEVTLKAAASIEVDVKSGRIMELELAAPAGIGLLSLTGPSIRQHRIEPGTLSPSSPSGGTGGTGIQRIVVEFTQEMDGRFRLEAAYERLLVPLGGEHNDAAADEVTEPDVVIPTLSVPAAEVEQGRIAVEALAAVEVRPSAVEGLTSLDAAEIPQRLVLLTTNPILHAYKYVGAAPSPQDANGTRLAFTVTRHETVDVHEAAIDQAEYRTLFTRDGLSVTAARFQVRNSRRQFLRLKLPPGSEIWSVFVDGRSEKPARTVDEDGEERHLIRIIHSTRGFDVELVFQTPSKALRGLGTISGVLPRPEILVTRTRWDVFLPKGVGYGKPSEEMELVAARGQVTAEDLGAQMALEGAGRLVEPLRPVIPEAGVHFAFEKLYANQGGRDAGFEIPYASGLGRNLGRLLSLAGASVFWIGLAFVVRGGRRLGAGLAVAGMVLLGVIVGHYQLGAGPAIWLSVLLLLGLGAYRGKAAWDRRRVARTS